MLAILAPEKEKRFQLLSLVSVSITTAQHSWGYSSRALRMYKGKKERSFLLFRELETYRLNCESSISLPRCDEGAVSPKVTVFQDFTFFFKPRCAR